MYQSNQIDNLQRYTNLIDSRILQRMPTISTPNRQFTDRIVNHQSNYHNNDHNSRNGCVNYRTAPFNNQLTRQSNNVENYSNDIKNKNLIPFYGNDASYTSVNQENDGAMAGPSMVKLSFTKENIASKELIDKPVNKGSSSFNSVTKKRNEPVRILTGSAEKIIKWHKINKDYFCYYEIIGAVIALAEGSVRLQKVMLLRDKKGPILRVVHYLNDHINIENFFVGQMLRCVGRMIGPNMMHGLSIREAKPDEIAAFQRMCYISDHAVTKSKK